MTGKASGRLLASLVLLGTLVGCKGMFGSQGLPKDPLFLDKRPVEAKPRFAPPVALAYSEPIPPANPFLSPRPGNTVPGVLTGRPGATVPDNRVQAP